MHRSNDQDAQAEYTKFAGVPSSATVVSMVGKSNRQPRNDLAILEQDLRVKPPMNLLIGLRRRARINALLERLQSGDLAVGAVCAELGQSELFMYPNGLDTQQRIRLYLDVRQERADFIRSCLPIVELARLESV